MTYCACREAVKAKEGNNDNSTYPLGVDASIVTLSSQFSDTSSASKSPESVSAPTSPIPSPHDSGHKAISRGPLPDLAPDSINHSPKSDVALEQILTASYVKGISEGPNPKEVSAGPSPSSNNISMPPPQVMVPGKLSSSGPEPSKHTYPCRLESESIIILARSSSSILRYCRT